jgi:ribose 5-phosphate isomerase B
VRCALAYDLQTATLGRQHNNANLVGIGARMHTEVEALEIATTFVNTPFSQDPRHIRRIEMLDSYERTGALPS